MRRREKREILDALISMQKAQERLKTLMQQEHKIQILTELQGLAIQIGEEIEKTPGKESIVKELESYCEVLYQISIERELTKKSLNLCIQLRNILDNVQRAVEKTETDKLEVVFLPYNASMWDCFDSVYQAAIEEKSVNVVVMPIPYYSKDETGTFSVYNYEGEKFPEYVEITDYRKYCMEERTPDVVFVHNPYDQYNTTTRVLPEYYSAELVKYTDHLVYIPYYISDKFTDEVQCYMPGVKYAWRVYVQSEYIRQQMLQYNETDKIKAMGSPKIDMVIRAVENPPEIPREWKQSLAGKKVFLVATTVTSILQYPQNVIDKMYYVMEFFKKNPSMAVIWRPHPLTEKSFKGELLTQYYELVKEFKVLENGVFDHSADNHRAMALSNAYIGERSSMLTLYKASGKPMYLMDWKINKLFEKKRYLSGKTFRIYDEELWIYETTCNQICRTDLQLTGGKLCFYLDETSRFQSYYYDDMVKYKEKLFFVACAAENNLLVDEKTGEKKEIPSFRRPNMYGIKNSTIQQENNKVYMFPVFYGDNIVVCDLETELLDEISIDYTVLKECNIDKNIPFWGKAYKNEEKMILPMLQETGILVIDGSNRDTYKFKVDGVGFYGCYSKDNNIYLLPIGGGDISRFDLATSEINILMTGKAWGGVNVPFSRIFVSETAIYLLPAELEVFIIYDLLSERFYTEELGKNKYVDYLIHEDKMYLAPVKGEECLVIDMKNYAFSRKKCEINITPEVVKKWTYEIDDVEGNQNIFGEVVCDLETFLNCMDDTAKTVNSERFFTSVDGTCGQNIWNDIIQELH